MELSEGDLDAFFRTPFEIYPASSLYVSPMKSDLVRFFTPGNNPLFPSADGFKLFVAERDGRLVGRIAAHVHPASNEFYHLHRGYFGYFDCADDAEAAALLLGAAEDWARARGFVEIAGNFNLTAMQQIGVMTGGFEGQPYVDQVYGPPHLPRLLEANGYAAEFPMQTFEVDLDAFDPGRLMGPAQQAILESADWAWAPVDRSQIAARLDDARALLNSGFAKNPMFVPLTKEEFDFQAKELKWIIDPRITAVTHYKGEPAGIVLVIPDLNPFIRATKSRIGLMTPWHFIWHRLNRTRALVVYLSVRADLQGHGLMGAMLARLLPEMRQHGYRKLGITWVWDGNAGSLRQMQKMGARPLHRTHLYRKALT
jgi:GNAT superfamily N-acetyltransferase